MYSSRMRTARLRIVPGGEGGREVLSGGGGGVRWGGGEGGLVHSYTPPPTPTPTDRFAGKVMFSQVCVIHSLDVGVCIPACTWAGRIEGGVCPQLYTPPPPPEMGTAVVGTHPNGMHPCYSKFQSIVFTRISHRF